MLGVGYGAQHHMLIRQIPAWTASPPVPGRMSRPMNAPASATAAATRKAVCIPLANVAWLMSVITRAAFDAYADAVIPALAGHWRSAPAPSDA